MNPFTKDVATTRRTTLNPIAAEFVPLALRSASGHPNNSDILKSETAENCGKAVLERTDSAASITSDDEIRQYWRSQLPDDITPDFEFFGEEDMQNSEPSVLRSSAALDHPCMVENVMENGQGVHTNLQKQGFCHGIDICCTSNGESGFAASQYGVASSFGNNSAWSASSAWVQNFVALDQPLMKDNHGHFSSSECDVRFLNGLLGEQMNDVEMSHMKLLATGFPGFAAESLADNYYANGGDLSSTVEMLTHLELQDNTSLRQSVSSKSLYSPNLGRMDFPAIPSLEMRNDLSDHTGDEGQQSVNMCRSGEKDKLCFGRPNVSGNSRVATDFSAVVRRSSSQVSGQWKYNRNGSVGLSVGSSLNPSVSESSFAGNDVVINGDKLHGYTAAHYTQHWPECGEAMGDIRSDLRLEAQGHTYFQNAYFEQARQAYFAGNKDLTKELGAKGLWYNGQMKAAYGRAGEAIFGQRNIPTTYLQNFVQGQERLIDLHGLNVNEAIDVLKHELNLLRNAARSTCQQQQVLICVGTGYDPKRFHMPARVSFAVERYLLEGEHLDYTEPQPGILQVVIY